jgi:hypothetical protein
VVLALVRGAEHVEVETVLAAHLGGQVVPSDTGGGGEKGSGYWRRHRRGGGGQGREGRPA